MDLNHSFTVPAPIDTVWAMFMDLEEVGGCFPGATVTDVTDDSFSGNVKVKLGPIALVYKGSGTFVERDDFGHRATIDAKGKDKRGNGTAGAKVTIQLTDEGGSTRADVATNLSVTGKPAQFGRGVMQDVSDKLLAQFVACIERKLTTPEDVTEPAVVGAPAAATGAAADSASPTRDDTADPAVGATGGSGPTPATSASATGPRHAAASSQDDALDLGGAVLPVVARQAAPYVGGLLALLLGGLLFKRLRRRGGGCCR